MTALREVFRVLTLAAFLLLVAGAPLFAQPAQPDQGPAAERGAPTAATVTVWNRPIVVFRATVRQVRPPDRAANAARRIEALLDETRIPAIVQGTIDLECGSTTNTLSRQEQVDFSHNVGGKRIAVYVSDRVILLGLAVTSKDPQQFAIGEQPLSYEPYGLMVRRGDAPFRLAVNRVLSQVYRSGDIAQIYSRWFGKLGPPGTLLLLMYGLHALPE